MEPVSYSKKDRINKNNNLASPVIIATYSVREQQQVPYLESSFHSKGSTTYSLCLWCINHHIQFRMVHPISFLVF